MSALVKIEDWTDERVDLLKRTMFGGNSFTNDEFALFLNQCKRTGLDPFSKQIHAVKRWNSKAKREVMTIQLGIDGFRVIAERTGQLDGCQIEWCGQDGIWKDVWLDIEPPRAAKVTIWRKGSSHPFPGVALWDEYSVKDRDGNVTDFWRRMASVMLSKCAEALALRRAFPQDLSGLYSDEEMAQADNDHVAEPAKPKKKELPPSLDPVDPSAILRINSLIANRTKLRSWKATLEGCKVPVPPQWEDPSDENLVDSLSWLTAAQAKNVERTLLQYKPIWNGENPTQPARQAGDEPGWRG